MATNRATMILLCSVLGWCAAEARAELGVTVSTAQPLNANAGTDSGGDFSPRVATDGQGHWVAVWYSDDSLGGTIGTDADILVARSVDNGDNWSLPAGLNNNAANDTNSDFNPDIATDRHGNWVAVWSKTGSMPPSDADILVARSIDNGANWSNPIPLNTNAAVDEGGDFNPTITSDGLGHWVATWNSNDDLGDTIGADTDILVARSVDNGDHWSNPIPLNSNAGGDTGSDYGSNVATDGLGNWVTVWSSDQNLGGTDGADYDLLVARSIDNGANWSAPIPLNVNAAKDGNVWDDGVTVTTDGQGNWLAVWTAYNPDTSDTTVLAARSNDNGTHWSSPIPIESAPSGYYFAAKVVSGAAGQWVAAWAWNINFALGGPIEIRLARSADNGEHWSTSSPIPGDEGREPDAGSVVHLATDRNGQWLVSWSPAGALGGTDADILMSRFALPDCNNNQIADATETLLGLLPDINGNRIPDLCEVIAGPPPGQNGGCGGGMCGVGGAAFAPITLLGMTLFRRSARRRRLEQRHERLGSRS